MNYAKHPLRAVGTNCVRNHELIFRGSNTVRKPFATAAAVGSTSENIFRAPESVVCGHQAVLVKTDDY